MRNLPLIFCAATALICVRPTQAQAYRSGGLIYSAQIDEVDWISVDQSFHYMDTDTQAGNVPLVASVQYLLRAHGIAVKPDGDFGPLTENAVKRFQRAHDLKADGIVGPRTWAKLVIPLARGARSDAVRALQAALSDSYKLDTSLLNSKENFSAMPRDGVFGPQTQRAVQQLQKNGGAHRINGKVNAQLWCYLMSSLYYLPGN